MASASEGRFGGARCLAALRLILSGCRAAVIPNQLALSFADQAYDDAERLKSKSDADALQAMVTQLIDVAQQMTRGA
jgi:NAD(P)H-dependent FMN reductase